MEKIQITNSHILDWSNKSMNLTGKNDIKIDEFRFRYNLEIKTFFRMK